MPSMTLYIGNKNLSSWSLRPWLALTRAGAAFEEVVIRLDTPESHERIMERSPTGKVPALQHGAIVLWESLAICEYGAELFPEAKLWPEDRRARAVARTVSHEMHAGFEDLRRELPMRVAERIPMPNRSEKVNADIARVLEIWRSCRAAHGAGGPFLFGGFSIADAMFAPVVTRFVTYGVEVDAGARTYMDAVLGMPEMKRWIAGAEAELRSP